MRCIDRNTISHDTTYTPETHFTCHVIHSGSTISHGTACTPETQFHMARHVLRKYIFTCHVIYFQKPSFTRHCIYSRNTILHDTAYTPETHFHMSRHILPKHNFTWHCIYSGIIFSHVTVFTPETQFLVSRHILQNTNIFFYGTTYTPETYFHIAWHILREHMFSHGMGHILRKHNITWHGIYTENTFSHGSVHMYVMRIHFSLSCFKLYLFCFVPVHIVFEYKLWPDFIMMPSTNAIVPIFSSYVQQIPHVNRTVNVSNATYVSAVATSVNQTCNATFEPTFEENLHYIQSYNLSSALPYMDILQLKPRPLSTIDQSDILPPIFVTGCSSNHFKENMALLENIERIVRPVIKDLKIVVYDLGLKHATERNQVNNQTNLYKISQSFIGAYLNSEGKE